MFRSGKLWLLFIFIICYVNVSLLIQLFSLGGSEYLGNVVAGSLDYPTYLAKMRLGYEGGWQYLNLYTTEPHQPSYIFLFYIALGHLARVAGLSLAFTYHAARIILSWLALVVLYRFLRKHAQDYSLLLFVLTVFITGTYNSQLDLAPQYHIFSGMMGFAHYMLALICLLVFFDTVLEYPHRSWLNGLKAVVALNILALIHPFMVVLVGLVSTGAVLLNKTFRKSLALLSLSALSVAPVMFYFFTVFTANPVLVGWREQAVTNNSLLTNLLMYGLGSIYAYFAVLLLLGGRISRSPYTNLCLSWLGIALALSFTNIITSRQQWLFFAGIPFAYLAYQFCIYLDKGDDFRVRFKGRSLITWVLIALILIPGLGFMVQLDLWTYNLQYNKTEHYDKVIPEGDLACYSWLREYAPKDAIILAEEKIGLLVPAFTGNIVFLGHHHETLNYKTKKERTEAFFSGDYSFAEAENFIKENNISYIFAGPDSQANYEFLQPVQKGNNLVLFRYRVVERVR